MLCINALFAFPGSYLLDRFLDMELPNQRLPWWLSGKKKKSACNAGDPGWIPGLERSPGEGNGYPLQYSCLEIPWTEEPGGLQYMGPQRVGHDLLT